MTPTPMHPADSGQTPPSVVYLLSRLGYQAGSELGRALGGLGLEPREFGLLRLLAGSRRDSQRALGAMLRITPNRMVALVDGLEDRGLIERRTHPDDRRAHTVTLTEKGAATLDQAFQAAFGVEAAVCASLEPAEREQLMCLLRKLAAAADERNGDLPGVHPAMLEVGGRSSQYAHFH